VPEASKLEAVMRYHERSKHHFNRFAAGPGALDWANQPDPFRRYAGAALTRLPILGPVDPPLSPAYETLYARGAVPCAPVTLRTLSRLLEYALALSAWKQAGGTRWALRANPSSGNLHPTEGYVLVGGIAELGAAPGLFHYAPREHGLERRADCPEALYARLLGGFPPHAFLVGLSSVHWREAWKYGERAFRYCQHDAGHAIGALREPHRAHASFGELAVEPPGTDAIARLRTSQRADCRLGELHDGFERLAGARRDRRKQLREHRPQVVRLGRQCGQPEVALGLLELERFLQQPVETVPVFGRQRVHGAHPRLAAILIRKDVLGSGKRTPDRPWPCGQPSGRYRFSDTASSKRARSQSRRTVRSFNPRAAAISWLSRPAK